MATEVNQWLLRLLDRLEMAEARLLSWGVVDGSFSKPELISFVADHRTQLEVPDELGDEDVVEQLIEHRLLIPLEYPGRLIFRSRMAETIRLLARLRQLFPKHLTGSGWQVAPNLVADFRVSLRPRLFPGRDIGPAAA